MRLLVLLCGVLLIFAAMIALVVLLVYGTVKKTRWGINVRGVTCPRCGLVQPKVRVPRSAQQTMWGGTTCPRCGAELDKWGRELAR